MTELFSSSSSRIFSIPAGANFLANLADTLVRDSNLDSDPAALADTLIYVPNRRSERALAFAIHQAAGGKSCLLPMIRALGDLETSDPPPSAETALANLPPVASPAERIGRLTRLVMAFFESTGSGMPATSCLSAARELARLLDQAALSGEVAWDELESMVPVQLAAHWQRSLKFLKIITDQWPAQLEEMTAMDPYARRLAAAQAMVEEWTRNPPRAPIIIAGSTGATPASRLLMQAALDAPQGCVVLPGLDLELSEVSLEQIRQNPSHPQFAMARALVSLSVHPSEVKEWPHLNDATTGSARRRLINEALAPAQNTADWTSNLVAIAQDGDPASFVRGALDGLTLLQATDENEEALLASLLLREALENEAQTAALVTPDAGLARRISTMLTRWDINVAPSAGRPLPQTDAGSLVLLVADWMLDPANPAALMALLKHPSSQFESAHVQALDIALRGPRAWTTWAELSSFLKDDDIIAELAPIAEDAERLSVKPVRGAQWYEAITSTAERISEGDHPWVGDDGASLSKLMQELAVLTEPLGDQAGLTWNELLKAEAQMQAIPFGTPHPRLTIWGPLEARLQRADHIILAGLNEGAWPEQPPPDAFLPRVFRSAIGLSDPDERIGLSAHDFAQLACAPRVTLLSSQRREDKPAIASRWIWRLQTLVRGALGKDADAALGPPPNADPRDWVSDIETAPVLSEDFSAEPKPCPPVSARPKELSVTRIEQLVRDPFAIYCEYVLGLRPLDPLNLPSDVRIRGTAVHKALERFELETPTGTELDLLNLLEDELKRGGVDEADIISLREIRRKVCSEYLIWRGDHSHRMDRKPQTEISGKIELSVQGEPFVLKGTADRIERRVSGKAAILDFKTGKPPTEKQVRAGLSPQMPLQGLIAREGGYEGLGRADIEALTYIRFGTSFAVQEIGAAAPRAKLEAMSMTDIIADAEAGLVRLLTAFADPNHPYLSAPRPERVQYESAYSRLARRDEWTGLSTYD